MRTRLATTLALAVLVALPAQAEWTTGLVHIQGVLSDPAGQPLVGTYSLELALYTVDHGGDAVWSETHPEVTPDGGVFSVLLGAQTPLFDGAGNLFADHPELWLGVTIDGGEELPRTRMAAVGLAYQAQHAEVAGVCEALTGPAPDLECSGCVGPGDVDLLHSDLGGLDADDHPHYLLADGGRALAGDLDLAGHQILNVVVHNAQDIDAPDTPLPGQLWWNTSFDSLFVYNGAGWVEVGEPIAQGALDLNCVDCVSADEVSFLYAGSTEAGGPAIDLACSGCVHATDVDAAWLAALEATWLNDGAGEIDAADDFGFPGVTQVPNLSADRLDGLDATHFSLADHDHDQAYLQDDAGEIDKAADFAFAAPTFVPHLDADQLDGLDASAFAPAVHEHPHGHDDAYVQDDAGEIDSAADFGLVAPTFVPNLDADRLDGFDAAAFVQHDEANSVTGAMVVDGTLSDIDLAADAAIAAAKVAGTAATLTGSQTFDGGTLHIDAPTDRVGVRTTSPAAALDVNGDVIIRGTLTLANRPEVVWDSSWFAMPFRSELHLDMGTADWDFVFGTLDTTSDNGGPLSMPMLGSTAVDYAPAYYALSGSTVSLTAWNYLSSINNLGDRNNLLIRGADVRLTAIQRAPDFDTGWSACGVNQTYIFQHNLGVFPRFAWVEVAQKADGTGWRVPAMTASNHSGSWRQTAMVELNQTDVKLRTHGSLAYFRNTKDGGNLAPSSGFCRVQLFDWAPDYDSGWVPVSTTQGDRDKWFHHAFGKRPTLYMVYVAQNANGSGWLLPAMGGFHSGYNQGVGVYRVTDDWAVIKGGSSGVAHFVDTTGNGISPNSGHVRFIAWR